MLRRIFALFRRPQPAGGWNALDRRLLAIHMARATPPRR